MISYEKVWIDKIRVKKKRSIIQIQLHMDKKSKILLIVLIAVTTASVGYTFWKTVIQQDFEVVNTESFTDSADSFEE